MGKSLNTRFINRVFTPNEQRRIFNSPHPDTILWALWAGKETAYKIVCKDDPCVPSSPRLYEVSLFQDRDSHEEDCFFNGKASFDGGVDTPNGRVHIRIFITRDYVHCTGCTDSAKAIDSVVWHTDNIGPVPQSSPDYESTCVRNALKKHLSAYVDRETKDIEIRREKGPRGLGPPLVYINGRQSAIDISLSHDGRFAAYAFTVFGNTCAAPAEDGTIKQRGLQH
jgi:phosphopantetheinyl transferase (holo-ACP synthase)